MVSARRAVGTVVAVVVWLGVLPAVAAAATFYVDDDSGGATNPCITPAAPCATVAQAVAQADTQPGSGDQILVDGGNYTESDVPLGNGNSLRESEFNTADNDTQAVITTGAAGDAIRVSGSAAGTIEGFNFVRAAGGGSIGAIYLNNNATVTGNTITGMSDAEGNAGITIDGGSPSVTQNAIFSPAAEGGIGIAVGGASPTIAQNTLSGQAVAITVGGDSTPTISGNTISGLASPGGSISVSGISVQNGVPTIVGNTISGPTPSGPVSMGIELAEFPSGGPTSATLARNRVSGMTVGYRTLDAPMSLHGDLAFGNSAGLSAISNAAPAESVVAENVTFYDNDLPGTAADVQLFGDVSLTLDSSILETPIQANGTSTCSVTFSRGPTTSGTPCEQFQTSAAPGFVAPSSGDYHLRPGSPLIDTGNPATPIVPNDLDFDGQARSQDGNCDGTARRDIGADERPLGDCSPPETTITSGPAGPTANAAPRFDFTSDEPGSTFECRVDAGAFAACSGPGASHIAAGLADGAHTFEVRAVDAALNTDPTPAARDFVVDTKAPDAAITSGPAGPTNDATPTFGLSSDDPGSSLECRVDGGAFAACSGPGDSHTAGPLADGAHRFEVRATDAVGNVDPTPAAREFIVDTTPPETTLTKAPKRRIEIDKKRVKAKFAFTASEAGSRFECRVDAGEFVPCDSGRFKRKVKQGRHTFLVRAIDALGNIDPTPASTRWRVVSTG